MNAFGPTAYLLVGCPFSARLRIFLNEAGLEDEINIVTVQNGDNTHRNLFAQVEETGLKPSFPLVEHAPGKFEIDSQTIIDRLSAEYGIDSDR